MSRTPESFELSHPYEPVHYGSNFHLGGESSTTALQPAASNLPFSRYNLVTGSEDGWDQQGFGRGQQSSTFHQLPNPPPPVASLGPGRIGKFGTDLVIEILLCASAVLATVPFLWLAIAMAKYDGTRVTEHDSEFIKQSTSTVSTLFTILFAAVVGTTLKRYATWHLGKGVKIGFLEQIMQSRTFFAALTTQISLGVINITAIILLCTWAFSPLGSQACLRLISTRIEFVQSSSLVSHVDTVTNQVFDSVSGVSSLLTSLKPTYVSTILSPPTTQNSSMDLWGNVKIPWLRDDLAKDDDGWTDVTEYDLDEGSYSSLVGIPIANLANLNSSFVIETTYMNLDCENPKDEPPVDIGIVNITSMGNNGTFLGPDTNVSDGSFGIFPGWMVAMDQFVSTNYFYGYPQQLENFTSDEVRQATFLFQTRNATSRCKIDQAYVESNVSCVAQNTVSVPGCAVKAQRRSPKKHAPAAVTTFSFPSTFGYQAQQWILATDKLSSSGYSSLAELYLQNTSAQFILAGNNRNYANYSNVTAEQFSVRLGQLMNTWILAGQISADTMDFGLDHQNLTASYLEGQLTYQCSWAWLAVYCASIAVMFAAALLTIWCAFHTNIPDVLSYCSSLTRDSRYFNFVPGTGSTIDGLQRAKAMQNVEIKLGEVVNSSDLAVPQHQQQSGYSPAIPSNDLRYLAIGPSDQVRMARRGVIYA